MADIKVKVLVYDIKPENFLKNLDKSEEEKELPEIGIRLKVYEFPEEYPLHVILKLVGAKHVRCKIMTSDLTKLMERSDFDPLECFKAMLEVSEYNHTRI